MLRELRMGGGSRNVDWLIELSGDYHKDRLVWVAGELSEIHRSPVRLGYTTGEYRSLQPGKTYNPAQNIVGLNQSR